MNANPPKRSLVLTTSYENTSSSSSSFQAVAFQNTKEVFIYETQAAPSTSSTLNNNNNNIINNPSFLIKQLSDGAKEIYASSSVTAFANHSPIFVVADFEEETTTTTTTTTDETTVDDEIVVRADNNNNVPFLTFFDATTGEPTVQQGKEQQEATKSSVVFLDEPGRVLSNQKGVDEDYSSSSLRISSLIFSSDDKFLYIAHEDFSLSVFDVESKTIVKRVEDRFCDLSLADSPSLDHQQTNLLLSPDPKGKILVIFNSSSRSLRLVATSGLTTPRSFPGSKTIKLFSGDNNDDENVSSTTIRVKDCCFSSDSLTLFVLVEKQKQGQQDDDSDLSTKLHEVRMFDTIRGNEIFSEGDDTGRHRLFSSSESSSSSSSTTNLIEKKSRHFSCMKTSSSSNGTLILLDEMNQELVLFSPTRNEQQMQHLHVDPLTSTTTTTTLHSPSKKDFMIATSSSNEHNNTNNESSSIYGAQRAAASLSTSTSTIRNVTTTTTTTKNNDQPQQQQHSHKTTAPLEVVADVDALSTSSSSVYTKTLVSSPSFSYSMQQNSTTSSNNNNNKKKGGISSSKTANDRQQFSSLNCRVVKMVPGNRNNNDDVDAGVAMSSSFDSFSFVPRNPPNEDEKNVMTILLTSSKTGNIKIIEINNKNNEDDKVDAESSVRGILEYQMIQKPNRQQQKQKEASNGDDPPPLVVERDTRISHHHHFCSLTNKPNYNQNLLLLLQHHHPLENCTRMTFFFFMSNFKRVIAGPLQVNNNNNHQQQKRPPFYMSALNFVSTKDTFPPSLESLNVECYFYDTTTTSEVVEFPIDDIIMMSTIDESKNDNNQETKGKLHHSSLHQNNSSSISPPPPRSLPRSVVETGTDPINFYEDMKRNLLEIESECRRVIENTNEFHLEHVFRFSFDRLQLENNEGLVRAFRREQQERISTDQKINSIQTRESLLREEIKCDEEDRSVSLQDVNNQFKNVICVEAQQREKIRREEDESHQDYLIEERKKNFQNSSSQTEENSKQQVESDRVKNHVVVENKETQVEQEEERQDEFAQNSNHGDPRITMLTNFSIRLLNDLESQTRQSIFDQQIECFNNEQKIFEQDRNRINTNNEQQQKVLLSQESNNEKDNTSHLRQLEKSPSLFHQEEITKIMKMQLEEQDQRHECEQEKITEEREIMQQQRITFMEHQQAFARKLEREKSQRLEEIEALKQKLTKSESQLENNRQEFEKLRKDEVEKAVNERKQKHEKEVESLKQQVAVLKEENQKQHEKMVASEQSKQKERDDIEDEKKKLVSIHQNQLATITSNFQSQISQMEKKNAEFLKKIESLQEQESKNEETVLQLQHDLDVKTEEIENLKEKNRKQRESFNLVLEQLTATSNNKSPSTSSSSFAVPVVAAEEEQAKDDTSSSPHVNVSKQLRMSSPEIPFTNNNKDKEDQNITNSSASPAVRATSNITVASAADNFHQHYSTATSSGTAAQAILILQSQHELEKHEMEEEFSNRLQEKDEALIATLDEITELRKEIEELKNSSQSSARTPTTKMSSSSPPVPQPSFFVRNQRNDENDHDDHSPLVSPSWKQKIQANLPNSSSTTSSPSRISRSQKYKNHHNNNISDVSLSPSSLTTTDDPYWRLQALQTFYKFDTQSLAAELYKTQTELATKSRQVDVANERLAIMIDELVVRENEAGEKEKKLRQKIQKLGGNVDEEEEDALKENEAGESKEKSVHEAAPPPIIHQSKNSHQRPREDEKLVDDMTHKELVEALKKPERKISEAILFGLDMDQEVDGYIFSHENFLTNFFESKDEASTLAASAPTEERQHFIQVRKEMLMRMRKERAKEEIEKRSKRNEEKELQRKKSGLCF